LRKNRKVKKKKPAAGEPAARARDRGERAARPPRPAGPARAAPAAPARRAHEAFGILTLAAALLIGPSLASHQFGGGQLMGPFGRAVGTALNFALGLGGYLIVLVLLLCALRIFAGGLGLASASPAGPWRERLGLLLLTLSGSALLHLGGRPVRIRGASPGGLVGEVSAETLRAVGSDAGAWVLAGAGLALALVLTTNISWARAVLGTLRLLRRGLAALPELCRRSRCHLSSSLAQVAQLLRRREVSAEAAGVAALPAPPVIRLDGYAGEPAPGARRATGFEVEPETLPEPAEEPLPLPGDLEIGRPAEPLPELLIDFDEPESLDAVLPVEDQHPSGPAPVEEPAVPSESSGAGAPAPAIAAPSEPAAGGLTIVQPQFREPRALPDTDPLADERHLEPGDGPGFVLNGDVYRPPPLSLLEYEENAESRIDHEAIYRQAERLVKTLADYKIEGRVTEVHPGPVVTMYEFVPAPGTRISKIANLANDLAMSLAAQRVRIVAPIPGKGAVGIEVPNERRETVYFKEIVAHDSFRNSKAALALALGKNIVGAPVTVDLGKMPHLLVAGATGAGKSVSINAMICSLLLRSTPEEVRLIMVDPKFLEFADYNDIPHLLLPVVTDPKKANIALRWAVNEMERRYQLLADMRVRDIAAYNRKVDKLRNEAGPAGRRKLPRRLPYIVVVIDEFADLMMVASKDVETSVARLAQKARAAGIHVILATQRPSVDVITGLIKANFPSRISFQVASGHDSKTILGAQGAENLLGAGDMLLLDRGADMKRIHGAKISDGEIRRVVEWLREQGRPIYDMDILKPPEDEDAPPEPEDLSDEMYDQAVALVLETRQASISMIQRRLRVGYNRAARMVERMEREGLVSAPDGVKGREVLVQQPFNV
jgi:S-DNA-T family DNA segregation ATPase FtsK/SpoIIIE